MGAPLPKYSGYFLRRSLWNIDTLAGNTLNVVFVNDSPVDVGAVQTTTLAHEFVNAFAGTFANPNPGIVHDASKPNEFGLQHVPAPKAATAGDLPVTKLKIAFWKRYPANENPSTSLPDAANAEPHVRVSFDDHAVGMTEGKVGIDSLYDLDGSSGASINIGSVDWSVWVRSVDRLLVQSTETLVTSGPLFDTISAFENTRHSSRNVTGETVGEFSLPVPKSMWPKDRTKLSVVKVRASRGDGTNYDVFYRPMDAGIATKLLKVPCTRRPELNEHYSAYLAWSRLKMTTEELTPTPTDRQAQAIEDAKINYDNIPVPNDNLFRFYCCHLLARALGVEYDYHVHSFTNRSVLRASCDTGASHMSDVVGLGTYDVETQLNSVDSLGLGSTNTLAYNLSNLDTQHKLNKAELKKCQQLEAKVTAPNYSKLGVLQRPSDGTITSNFVLPLHVRTPDIAFVPSSSWTRENVNHIIAMYIDHDKAIWRRAVSKLSIVPTSITESATVETIASNANTLTLLLTILGVLFGIALIALQQRVQIFRHRRAS